MKAKGLQTRGLGTKNTYKHPSRLIKKEKNKVTIYKNNLNGSVWEEYQINDSGQKKGLIIDGLFLQSIGV